MKLLLTIVVTILLLQNPVLCKDECEGAVTFYYTEKGEERTENMRNYGLLEEKLEERFYRELTEYFNPKNVYAYTMEGDCCWEIFAEEKYKKPKHALKKGFNGIPNYPQFNVNSMKQTKCK